MHVKFLNKAIYASSAVTPHKSSVTALKRVPFYPVPLFTRLDELMTQEGALKLKEKLLEQEKDLVVTQNEWLTQELNSRSEQLIQLRKERVTTMANLNSQVAIKDEEVRCALNRGYYFKFKFPLVVLFISMIDLCFSLATDKKFIFNSGFSEGILCRA